MYIYVYLFKFSWLDDTRIYICIKRVDGSLLFPCGNVSNEKLKIVIEFFVNENLIAVKRKKETGIN